MSPKKQTAAELLAELQGDPAFVAQRLAREDVRRVAEGGTEAGSALAAERHEEIRVIRDRKRRSGRR